MISKSLVLIAYLSILLLVLFTNTCSSAPTTSTTNLTDPSNDQETDSENELKFTITETFHGKIDTKDLACGETTATGTHPHPREACDDILSILNGTNTTPPPPSCMCTEQYDPVDINVIMRFPQQDPYTFFIRFQNACQFHCKTLPVPHFVDIGVVPPSSVDDNNDDDDK